MKCVRTQTYYFCIGVIVVVVAWFCVLSGDPVLLDQQSASNFLSRSLLYNSWDFELVVADSLQRECIEEMCSYEEAREVFEDDAKTVTHTLIWDVDSYSWIRGHTHVDQWDVSPAPPTPLLPPSA